MWHLRLGTSRDSSAMREPTNDQMDLDGLEGATDLKRWASPSLVRLDAECAEANAGAGPDAFGSIS